MQHYLCSILYLFFYPSFFFYIFFFVYKLNKWYPRLNWVNSIIDKKLTPLVTFLINSLSEQACKRQFKLKIIQHTYNEDRNWNALEKGKSHQCLIQHVRQHHRGDEDEYSLLFPRHVDVQEANRNIQSTINAHAHSSYLRGTRS